MSLSRIVVCVISRKMLLPQRIHSMTTISNNNNSQRNPEFRNRGRYRCVLLATMLCFISQTIPLDAAINVVSYWRLGENDPGAASGVTATTAVDSAGTKNLKFQGNARYTNDVATTAASHTGSSLSVNFTNSAYATNTVVSTATDNFGIECWAKPTAFGGGQVIAYNGGTGGVGDGGWGIIIAANNTYQGLFGGVAAFGSTPATLNTWTHLALVRASGTTTLFINGAAVATDTTDTPGVASGNFALGAPPQSPTSQFFTGLIDEVRVFTFAAGQFNTNDLLLNQNLNAYAVGTTNLLEGPASGSDSVVLSATPLSATWTNTANASWLHLTAANQSGTGSTNIIFTFDANSGGGRTGTLTIVGQTVTVTQAGTNYVRAGTLTTLASSLNHPGDISVDSAGNVYIANSGANTIVKWSRTNNAVSTAVPVSAGLSSPQGVAADNFGNLFIADLGNEAVKKWNLGSSTMSTIMSSGIGNPWAIAADRSGNAFFVGNFQGALYEWVAASNSVITHSPGVVSAPQAVTVDAADNAYVPDSSGFAIMYEYVAASGQWVQIPSAGVSSGIGGVAVDGSGNLYTATFTANSVVKWTAATGTQSTLATSGMANNPEGVAVDSSKNVYITDTSGNRILELPYAFVNPSARSETAAAGSDALPAVLPASVNLAAPFLPTSDQSWLTITGTNNGVVSFSFTSNTGAPRTAHISLLGQTITVTQGAATISLATTNLVEGPIPGTDSAILLLSPGNFPWTATANTSWLHLAPGFSSGLGSTNVFFSFDTNSGPTRTGTITIANQTLTVIQAGATYVGYNNPGQFSVQDVTIFHDPTTALLSMTVDNAGDAFYYEFFSNTIYEWIKTNNTIIPFISNGLSAANGLAFDQAGNLYISDGGDNTLKKWSAANGTLTTLVNSGLNNPIGISVDAAGNVFIADTQDNAIKEWVAASSNLVTVVSTGLSAPAGVAVDLLGNVYIADTTNSAVKVYTPSNGNVVTLMTNTPDGHFVPSGIAVDNSGNVYITDLGHGTLWEWSPSSQSSSNPFRNSLAFPVGVAVDAAGNIVICDDGARSISVLPRAFLDNSRKNESYAAGNDVLPVVVPGNANLSPPFFPTSSVPWLTITGVTNGVTSFSFAENDTGAQRLAFISCFGETISVDQGAVALGTLNLWEGPTAGTDSVVMVQIPVPLPWTASANANWLHLAPAFQSGTGNTNVVFSFDTNSGPTRIGTLTVSGQTLTVTQAGSNYVAAPVPVTALVSNGLASPSGVTVDANGNAYFTDSGNNSVKEWVAASNTVSTLATGFTHPNGVTLIDSAGDALITDSSSSGLYGLVSGSAFPLVSSGLSSPFSSAIDLNITGNIYVCDTGDSAIQIWNQNNGTVSPLVATGLNHPKGLVADLAGNLYIADTGNNSVKEWLIANSNVITLVPSGLASPSGVAVDGAGNVYIADTGNNAIKKWNAATHAVSTLASGLSGPASVAVDSFENVYIADTGNNQIKELPRAFVDPTPKSEPVAAGTDALSPVLPPVSLMPPFTPTSDQSWLTITGTGDDAVAFSFTDNSGSSRTGNIGLLGELISVTQLNVAVTPPFLTGAALGNGVFQFGFTNSQTTNFTVLSTTNLSLPMSNWTVLGSPSNPSAGVFQFTTTATNDSRRFYRVRSP